MKEVVDSIFHVEQDEQVELGYKVATKLMAEIKNNSNEIMNRCQNDLIMLKRKINVD